MISIARVRCSRFRVFAAAALLAVAAHMIVMPAMASALTISGPAAVFESGRYYLKWASADPTGTAVLYRSGVRWASVDGTPGATVLVGTVKFPSRGLYHLTARLEASPTVVQGNVLDVRSYYRPARSTLVGIAAGNLVGRVTRVKVSVGSGCTFAAIYVNGKYWKKANVRAGTVADFGTLSTSASQTGIRVVGGNPAGSVTTSYDLKLFSYPSDWKTCIVISTGQRRLYWIVNDVLVKSYPVATGRPSMPTPHRVWRIGAKYYTSPSSVYGPRKMRLFKKVGSTYQYTAYNIHGTNNENSIGTYASHGCIRMYNHDVLELFPQVPLYTLVLTRG